jgi:hypothetical protein
MDPITPGIISGLAVNAIVGLAGQVNRNRQRKREHAGKSLAMRLSAETSGLVLSAMSQLNSRLVLQS